ncbi:LytTR family transcriptional regulator [Prauserella marina]|uniref:Cell envelope-related function transcriptional attenuator common domain-containing protein n=1 Tax=Prauserella marina TaxID=530584 RepID=A0A222VSE5_9PSEU|nr:LCP family protein [Prauserella marina]ASR36829.1 LytTR family transcriptional regulator [Prauserella marina]PWV80256.1 LytR family transcriptional attenuator [Prauserella marina]SDD50390.1 cell envelope-related function transcriptional attenuator common domain-containing protein [Prauserella marina]
MTYGGYYGGEQPPPPGRGRPPRGPRRHQGAQMLPIPGSDQARQRPPRQQHQPTRVAPAFDRPPPQQPPGHGDGMPPERPRKRRRWSFGKVAMALLLVFVLAIAIVWLYLEFSINRIDALHDYEGRPAAAAGTNWLIVGSDSREGLDAEQQATLATGDTGGKRTDTIMVAHLPDNDTKPTLVSLPRDLQVEIPGYGTNKINAAFSFGGAPLLAQTIEQNTGLRIDHYAEIGFGGFASMVDAMGGVEMDIPEEMSDPMTNIVIPAGKQKLDGAQALGFVRMRYSSATPRSDLDRVANQRMFIGAMVSQMSSPSTLLNPFDLFPLLSAAPDALTMDEGDHLHNLVAFAWAMRGISDGGVVTTTVPVTSGSAEQWDEAKAEQLFEALRNDTPVPDSVIYN